MTLTSNLTDEEEARLNALLRSFKGAVLDGDYGQVGRLVRLHSSLRQLVDTPLVHFEKPAIVFAAQQNNRRLIGVLLSAGANINVKSSWAPGGWAAIDVANHATARYLLKHGAQLTVHAAARLGFSERLKEMLAIDPSLVNAPGGDGTTALHVAKNAAISKLLLEHGADIDALDIDHGSTPAQWSIDNPSKVRYLIAHGAAPDIFLACALGDRKIAKLALAADPKCLDYRIGGVPFTGGENGHIYMYTKGIGPTARPLQLAAERGQFTLASWLLQFASPSARLIYGCRIGDSDIIDTAHKELGDIPNSLSPDDQGAIADAGWDNRPDVIDRMLNAGFPIDTQGRENGTALERAAVRGWPDTVRFLVDRGASLEIKNQYGGAPLGAAYWGKQNWNRPEADYDECIRILTGEPA